MEFGRVTNVMVNRWLAEFTSIDAYISLHSSNPDMDDPFLSEISGGAYARVSTKFGPAGSSRAVWNTRAITFVNLPSSLLVYAGIWETPFGGDMLGSTPLAKAVRITNGAGYSIGANNLVIALP